MVTATAKEKGRALAQAKAQAKARGKERVGQVRERAEAVDCVAVRR
jgi:hypothetical protein